MKMLPQIYKLTWCVVFADKFQISIFWDLQFDTKDKTGLILILITSAASRKLFLISPKK